MQKVILLRYGEIFLKGNNRGFFERLLIDNIKDKLNGLNCNVMRIAGRYLITNFEDEQEIIDRLKTVFGLVSLSVAMEINTNIEEIKCMVSKIFKSFEIKGLLNEKSFKISVTRADKTFSINSDKFSAEIGGVVLNDFPNLKVNLKNPDIDLIIEIRENKKTYILYDKIKCQGGMPVGSAGQGLLLLSGGIDSPVAGYMMGKRGLKINAIHFHSFPYTSVQAKEKVITLAEKLTKYVGSFKIYMIPFTKIQEHIHAKCDDSFMITIMRRIMMRISEEIALKNQMKTIVTGESLGQVASQTVESITVTNNVLNIVPVLRPLIGMDKSEIIDIAKRIDTFETSILPYEDCCTVFLPKNPVIKPTIERAEKQEQFLDLIELIEDAINNIEIIDIKNN